MGAASLYLEISKISHAYGAKAALRNVSFGAERREVLALLGPSGSGKSTLLSIIAGIIRPSAGEIYLEGRNLLELPPEARGLGMVFQDFALWPHMTVAQNIAFPLRARRFLPSEIIGRVQNALARVGLEGFEDRRPHQLSGGQQQRVALARAVIAETRLLLLDEPLSALDPATRSVVRGELAAILRKLNLTTIIVTHDREEAFELADRIAVLVDGKIQQHALPEDVYERPANATVARFMGANLLSVRVLGDGSAALEEGSSGRLTFSVPLRPGEAQIAIVPEQVRVAEYLEGMPNVVAGRLVRSQYRGGEYRLLVRLGNPASGQIVEARSKHAPRDRALFIHLPVEAIHILQPTSDGAASTSLEAPRAVGEWSKFREELT